MLNLFNSVSNPTETVRVLSRAMMTLVLSFSLVQLAVADAPLKSKLGLDVDQAQTVSQIQKRYRAEKRSIRQVLNQTSRKLRRAKSANDSEAIENLTQEVVTIEQQLRAAILGEDREIRQILSIEQRAYFEDYIEVRDSMVGSSRDVKVK